MFRKRRTVDWSLDDEGSPYQPISRNGELLWDGHPDTTGGNTDTVTPATSPAEWHAGTSEQPIRTTGHAPTPDARLLLRTALKETNG